MIMHKTDPTPRQQRNEFKIDRIVISFNKVMSLYCLALVANTTIPKF